MEDFRFDDENILNEAPQTEKNAEVSRKKPGEYTDFLLFRATVAAILLVLLLLSKFLFPDIFKTVRQYYSESFGQNVTAQSLLNEGGHDKK